MRDMRAYVIKRLLLVIPTLFLLTVLVFLSVRFLPGDAIDAMISNATWVGETSWDVDREGLRHFLGLDVPAHVQYGRWLKDIFLHGTLGLAVFGHIPIEERILQRLPVTVELAVMAIVIGQLIALPAGIYSAIRQDTPTDYVARSIAIIGMATPNFWLAVMVMVYPVIWWGWAPQMELIHFTEDPLGNLGMFIIPALIMGTGTFCRHDAPDAHHDVGGAQAGLYQDSLGQRSQREGGHYETCGQECLHPDSNGNWRGVAHASRWLRYHGEHI